jgi:phosphoribosylformylglycinamidine cyclo-ligase
MDKKITYRDAGVDIDLADKVLGKLSETIRSTHRPEVIGKMGGFAAMFRPDWARYKDPILVSATDGVGTKLKIAFMMDVHNTVGIDLVAMNVNDLLVLGAEPLFFLDYFATGSIKENIISDVISGIAEGCRQAGCSLIGGETAEMPDFYPPGEYDLAGFCVGMTDGPDTIDGSQIKVGDALVGIESSGLHSNGFSLVRKALLEYKNYNMASRLPDLGRTLGEVLLEPTKIYVKPVLDLCASIRIRGMAHITGGGFIGNIPRILPDGCSVVIRNRSWDIPPIFRIIKNAAGIDDYEMFRTFNMGIGFVLIIQPDLAEAVRGRLRHHGLESRVIGEIIPCDRSNKRIDFV